jgi:hypothetical protein
MPPEARELTAAGAEAFARYFFEVLEHAYETGDVQRLEEVATSECGACSAARDEIRRAYDLDQRFSGVRFTVHAAVATEPETAGSVVSMSVTESASQVLSADGALINSSDMAAEKPIDLFLVFEQDSWKVFGVGVEP